MHRNLINIMTGLLAMIVHLISYCAFHSTIQLQMKELKLKDTEIHQLINPDQSDETIYHLSFRYERKLRHAKFYYQEYTGTIEKNLPKEKCIVKLTNKYRELPRSVYPLLSQGFIVVQFSRFGWETYQVVKEFKKSDSILR